jgi:cell division septum initiation protein DivIVA
MEEKKVNLTVEEIIKAMEWCEDHDVGCVGCPIYDMDECANLNALAKDALRRLKKENDSLNAKYEQLRSDYNKLNLHCTGLQKYEDEIQQENEKLKDAIERLREFYGNVDGIDVAELVDALDICSANAFNCDNCPYDEKHDGNGCDKLEQNASKVIKSLLREKKHLECDLETWKKYSDDISDKLGAFGRENERLNEACKKMQHDLNREMETSKNMGFECSLLIKRNKELKKEKEDAIDALQLSQKLWDIINEEERNCDHGEPCPCEECCCDDEITPCHFHDCAFIFNFNDFKEEE